MTPIPDDIQATLGILPRTTSRDSAPSSPRVAFATPDEGVRHGHPVGVPMHFAIMAIHRLRPLLVLAVLLLAGTGGPPRVYSDAAPAAPAETLTARDWAAIHALLPASQQAYFKASQISVSDQFGRSVAVSGDTVVISANAEDSSTAGVQHSATPTVDEGATDAGAVYVFVRSGTTWTQQAYLKASQVSPRDDFGFSVAVAGDTLVVGAIQEDSSTAGVQNSATPTVDEAAADAGAAYVFVRTGTTWTQQAYLKASQVSAGDFFGHSVAVAGDTILVGAEREDSSTAGVQNSATPTVDEGAADAGAAYVFVRSGTTWTQQAYLKASQVSPGDRFGTYLAVADDTLVVGAHFEDSSTAGIQNSATPTVDEGTSGAGAAYVFVRSGTTWTQQTYLKASQVSAGDRFGTSVAVAGDTLVVGADREASRTAGVQNSATPTVDEGAAGAGAAYVFVRSGTTWTQQAYLKASQVSADDTFGWGVAVAGDTVVVGAIFEDSSTAGVQHSATPTVDEGAVGAGAAYVYVRHGTTWRQQVYLKASQVSVNDTFGWSVAVDGDTVVVGSLQEDSSTVGVQNSATPIVDEGAGTAGAAYGYTGIGATPAYRLALPLLSRDSRGDRRSDP